MLDGYKTYVVALLTLVATTADGLVNGNWHPQLAALALLATTLRDAIEKKKK